MIHVTSAEFSNSYAVRQRDACSTRRIELLRHCLGDAQRNEANILQRRIRTTSAQIGFSDLKQRVDERINHEKAANKTTTSLPVPLEPLRQQ